MVDPLMNAEYRNKWMLLRLTHLTRWRLPLALLSVTASPTLSFSQGILDQRLACTPDVLRLCSAFINALLCDACRTAFEAGMKQLPNASDSTQSRKRPPQ